MSSTDLLCAYDTQLRTHVPDLLPAGVTVERDGPLLVFIGYDHGGFITYRDLGGLTGATLDSLIARQRELFGARGERVEWKLHAHDRPADLPDRLRAAGFMPEDLETVLVGLLASAADQPAAVPEGIVLREVSTRADLMKIVALEEAVWGENREWLADVLGKELAADPASLTVVVAESSTSGGQVVCAGWVRYMKGTSFATFWGGSTLPAYRRRGIYRAVVTYRARLAARRGYTYMEVDASPNSRPILERLGLIAVTSTTPYIFDPKRAG